MSLSPLPAGPGPNSGIPERRRRSKRWGIDPGPRQGDAAGAHPASGIATSFDPLRLPRGRAALVVAHPGHELRVHGWIEAVRPLVHVLTDGSGSSGRSRLESTRRVLGPTGA